MLLTTYHLSQASSQGNHILTTKNLFLPTHFTTAPGVEKDHLAPIHAGLPLQSSQWPGEVLSEQLVTSPPFRLLLTQGS